VLDFFSCLHPSHSLISATSQHLSLDSRSQRHSLYLACRSIRRRQPPTPVRPASCYPVHIVPSLYRLSSSPARYCPSEGDSYSQLPALGSFAFQFLAIHPCGVVSSFSALGSLPFHRGIHRTIRDPTRFRSSSGCNRLGI
jgi:hypothetical protein